MVNEERVFRDDRYLKYLADIEIARNAIINQKLYPKDRIIYDLYAIPSHNFQTYYALVYKHDNHYEMVYAKPVVYTAHSVEPIKMYSFSYCAEAEKRLDKNEKIIAGIKHLSKDFVNMLEKVSDSISGNCMIEENSMVIDGVLQVIRVFDKNRAVKTLMYTESNRIPIPALNMETAEFLSGLYIHIGEMID